jgi:hypothetical protein
MPVVSPGGLHVRISPPAAFTLMARLYPQVTPELVLRTTEALLAIPNILWFLAAMVALLAGASLWLVVIVAGLVMAGMVGLWSGALVNRSTATLGSGWNIPPFFVPILVGFVVAYLVRGWAGVAGWVAASAVAYIVGFAMEGLLTKTVRDRSGIVHTKAEVAFLQAYRLLAAVEGKSGKIRVTESEIELSDWQSLAAEYQAVSRRPVVIPPGPPSLDFSLSDVD